MDRRSMLGGCVAAIFGGSATAIPAKTVAGGIIGTDGWGIFEADTRPGPGGPGKVEEQFVTFDRGSRGAKLDDLLAAIPRSEHTIVLQHPNNRGLTFITHYSTENPESYEAIPIKTTIPPIGTIDIPHPREHRNIRMQLFAFSGESIVLWD